jgi:hypothetical protein
VLAQLSVLSVLTLLLLLCMVCVVTTAYYSPALRRADMGVAMAITGIYTNTTVINVITVLYWSIYLSIASRVEVV